MAYSLLTFVLGMYVIYDLAHNHAREIQSGVLHGELFVVLVSVAFYLIGKLYCLQWAAINEGQKKQSTALVLYERVFLPVALISFAAGSVRSWLSEGRLPDSALALFVIFLAGDWFLIIRRHLQSIYVGLHEMEKRKLFLRYPPQSRFDMLPFDIIFNAMFGYVLYSRLF